MSGKLTAEEKRLLKQATGGASNGASVTEYDLSGRGLLPRIRYELRRFKKETDAKLSQQAEERRADPDIWVRSHCKCSSNMAGVLQEESASTAAIEAIDERRAAMLKQQEQRKARLLDVTQGYEARIMEVVRIIRNLPAITSSRN